VSPYAAVPLPAPGQPLRRIRLPSTAARAASKVLAAKPAAAQKPQPGPRDVAWYRAQDATLLSALEAIDPASFGAAAIKRGRTQLLYRAETHRKLQRLREAATFAAGATIQRVVMGAYGRAEAAGLRRMRAALTDACKQRTLVALDAALAGAAASLAGNLHALG
jgi:hypothetical protein